MTAKDDVMTRLQRIRPELETRAVRATHEQILADYPYLEAEDIIAALQFAARQNDHPVLRGV